MNSIISTLKSYTLLVGVIAASVVLIIVFLFQKENDKTSIKPSGEMSISTNQATEEIHQPATFATDSSGNKITQTSTISNQSDIPLETDITQSISEPTDTANNSASPQFKTVEDDYFYDSLFIGNSRTVGLSLFGSMPKEATFYATVGMNIYDLMTSTAQVPPEEGPEQSFESVLSSKQYGKVYIMLGINDLGTGTSESFAEYYKSIIDKIHMMQPNAIIYIQSIINISAERDAQGDAISNSNINEKNALLEQIANNDYIYYLNINEVLIDSNGYLNSDYTSDGVHLGGGSLSLWENYLYSHAIVK
ncbi:MAG: hypothetical protein K2H01_04450 [Ruminococcus sp.]|nr:hypothetical protein [Ruminococcus sp.]